MADDELIRASADAIKIAFADVPYPGDGNIAPFQEFEGTDDWDCANILKGKHWREVTASSLAGCNNPFLTPKAYHFYLPAYMLGRLLFPKEIKVAGDAVIYSLEPPLSDLMLERLELFSEKQKQAVCLFLEAIAANPGSAYGHAQIALDGYWKNFKDTF